MISYIRRNMISFVALFIAIISFGGTAAYAANTIRSSDIVDGQVMNQDLADNSVGTHKIQEHSVLGVDIKDNALGAAQIKESTLGQVPNAKTVDGIGVTELRHTATTSVSETDVCAVPFVYSECGPYSLTVPAGHQYTVTVTSSITADPVADQDIFFCPATSGPTCINRGPEVVSLSADHFTNATTSETTLVGPGTYTISTAVKVQGALAATGSANTATTVEFYDNQVTLGNG